MQGGTVGAVRALAADWPWKAATVSRKPHKVDVELTASRGYKNSRSYVTVFGAEYLFGEDKTARRWEIYRRDKGRCFACDRWLSFEECEWEHRVPQSQGGDDSKANGRISCAQCHARKHGRVARWSRCAII